MAKPVHSMVRVFDEAKSLDFYARAFGLQVADHLKFPDFALIYLRHPSSPFEVELTVNFDRNEPYSLGDGYGHLAVVVDDVDAEHSRFERENLSPGPLREGQLTAVRTDTFARIRFFRSSSVTSLARA